MENKALQEIVETTEPVTIDGFSSLQGKNEICPSTSPVRNCNRKKLAD